ncbi:hypothetical protein [Bdellovibrio sp. HCB274]|uniref:hypothetical protein n=1 Tax=Bdellovibrio sp. HCB274 TaxID=3394361 RepID=UPI0039B69AB2
MAVFYSFILLIVSVSAFAQSEPDYQALFKNLEKLRTELSQSEKTAVACEVPTVAKCDFGDYCQQLRSQSQNFYLYKNAAGKSVPNFFFLRLAKQVEGCLGKPLPEVDTQNPFVNPLKLDKSNAAYKAELARTQSIFSDVQKRAVALLEKRRTAENSAQIDQEIKRLKSVKMTSPLFKDAFAMDRAGCGLPNATYQSDSNSIEVCPQMLNLPDSTLFSILSHEISHSVDPCNAHKHIAGTSVPAGKNPMQDVVSCLAKPTSMGAKIVSEKSIIARITGEEDSLAQEMGPLSSEVKADFKKKKSDVSQNFATHQHCRGFSGNADMQEGFADWMSAKIMAQKVSEITDPKQAKDFAYEAQLFIAGSECQNVKVAAINRVAVAVEKECPPFAEYKEILLNPEKYQDSGSVPHPKSSRRVDKVLFAPSEIQKALGCKADPTTSVCE